MRFARNALATPASRIREIVHLVIESGDGVVRLEVGESALDTPSHIVEAAHRAALDGHTRYTSSTGIGALREAVCEKLGLVNGVEATPDHVAVTAGAIEALFLALASLCEPGDEVLVPDPGWPNYEMIATLIGARCRAYACPLENGCVPSPEAVAAAIGPRTRILVLNSPNNPTGAVYPPDVIAALAALCRERGIVLLSDETYDELYFDAPPVSALRFAGVEAGHVASVFSFSKTHAMTGWRVGYLVGPRELVAMAGKLQEPLTSCAASVSQYAALAALRGPQDGVAGQRADLLRAREVTAGALERAGCRYLAPGGAFYLWLAAGGEDSIGFAHRLLAEERIAVAPGRAFGPGGEGFVRICFAALGNDAEDVMGRVAAAAVAVPERGGVA